MMIEDSALFHPLKAMAKYLSISRPSLVMVYVQKLNELISYETEAGRDGKSRAVRIMRPGQRQTPRYTRTHAGKGGAGSALERIVGILIVVAICSYGYSRISKPIVTRSAEPIAFTASTSAPASNFKCDGRTMCSQMTSCAEAIYFLQNCPTTKMDGDHDGSPCEQQWCN